MLSSDDGAPLCRPHAAQRRAAAGGSYGGGGGGGASKPVPMSRAALAVHEAACQMIDEHRRAWGGSHCVRCAKPVYAMERQLARTHRGDNLIFHKACFRCEDCGTLLRPDSWEVHGDAAALEAGRGALLCRVHFAVRVQAEGGNSS